MERKIKKGFLLVFLGLLFVMIPAEAFPWGQATHAYIVERLGARAGYNNLYQIWGSVAPDFYNYVFDPALCPGWVADQTQGTYFDSVLKVWNNAETQFDFALAYGFVSHNQALGADYVAHISGLRPGYENDGYIIIKARQLLSTPLDPDHPEQTFGDVFASFGMSPDEALLAAHGITEFGIDVRLGNEVETLLGRKLAAAARNDTKRFQPLLVKAFAADYAAQCFGGNLSTAASVLIAAEKMHRKDMIYLGQAISQPEPVAAQMLAEQLVGILSDLLGKPLPDNAAAIFQSAMLHSMILCDDYQDELEATIQFVAKNMKDQGITYDYHGK